MGASERNEEARAAWREQLKQLDARQLVVLDECGSNIALTPLYARAPQGQRAYGSAPRNRGKNTTLIAALTFEGMGESMIIEGAANAAAFERYVEKILAPSLSAGQIVIMDNLAAHKGKKVEELIQARGCQLLFLPASSPDFSPIEETFSKVKTFFTASGSAHARSLAGSHLSGITHGDGTGCTRLVSSLRLSAGQGGGVMAQSFGFPL